jgi:hypothetical protein
MIDDARNHEREAYHLYVLIVMKCGSLNLLEPTGPVQACYGIALPFTFPVRGKNYTKFCRCCLWLANFLEGLMRYAFPFCVYGTMF